ncbi:MAG: hypothetical protein AB7I30_01130 [Isosphaeraceae bacterium]
MATLTLSATVENLFRLAWHAERSGRSHLRDAMLTLAVAESGPDEAVLAERCRRLLIARQPDHWYASTATLGQALTHSKVVAIIDRLRAMFPPIRVQRWLFRFAVEQGAFNGSDVPLRRVFEDLGLLPARGNSAAGRQSQAPTVRFPTPVLDGEDRAEHRRDLGAFYLSLLFSMAVLIETVSDRQRGAADRDTRAA